MLCLHNDHYAKLLKVSQCLKFSIMAVKINYYGVLYKVGDKDLIRYFWRWYNSHKVKSKQRAARCVLLSYYSTTSRVTPKIVMEAFTLRNDIRISKENIWL